MKALIDRVASFARDRRGNIAMMFALMLFVILGGAGIAIDLQRSNMVRAEIAEATDAGLIAAARHKSNKPNADDAELTAVARRVFDNAIRNNSSVYIDAFAVTFDAAAGTFALETDARINPLIMGVLGQETIDVGTRSEVRLGKPPLLEVAMALDVTGSMNQMGKIGALRTAAIDLVESLFQSEDADVKIGIVPFAQYVNVGAGNGTASWLSNPGGAWAGCVGSRAYPLNVEDSDFSITPAPGVAGAAIVCPRQLLPLSTDAEELAAVINSLTAEGSTYIPAGLAWAWALLTPSAPFTEGLNFSELAAAKGTKALIVMTDGENTRAPDYPTHESSDQTLADQLTEELCVNIKAQDIIVYSIAFSVTQPAIKEVLEECATSPSHYFDAENAGQLADAFAAIASSLRNISLSK